MTSRVRASSDAIVARGGHQPGEAFRAIAELDGQVAWIVDCASCLPRYISASVEQLLGYDFDAFHQQLSSGDPAGPLAELCAGLPARLARLAAGDRSRVRLVRQYDQLHRDGRQVPIEVISQVLPEDAGQPGVLVGVMRDLSAQRERDAAQQRFTRMLNHEFRTPLSTIDGAIQRLEVTGARADTATRERYRKISKAVERLIGMLDEYLSPDRMEAVGRGRQPDKVDPRQLLEEAAAAARAAGHPVTLALGKLPPVLRCEPQGLRLALKVLIDNAIQYSPAGAPIALSAQAADGGVELLVRDHGGGVPPGESEHIFAKAWRGSNALARPGSGLGLYMARSVIEVHGGVLGVRDAIPHGAEFRIWLPIRDSSGKNVASVDHWSDNSGNKIGAAPGPKCLG